MTTSPSTPYHHGDLPTALVTSAMELLEEDPAADLSLRAVARRAGVSAAAPYRHFADRNALASAVAAVGYDELAAALLAVSPAPSSTEDIAGLAVAYVRFALDRPGLFRVMFTEGCDLGNPDRVDAVAAINTFLAGAVQRAAPDADPEPTALGAWALVHGLAFLHLDGKLDASSPEAVADRVRSTVAAILR
ncbi:TetR/AcrR family transcriptional regulator [Gordonia sp. X0973]|uniref:TetR/AcrR family transcriptional regulator n=1 Tax=Gordonia sp. X0973 TaxID=2742602 RepID=UPI000F52FCEE|nr:TetR/AcrR family transcriptional regulator [Gordonia sp. X0973]QKT07761.1 TetR/AcrR family transcriptional regulator [Gordonia sp. X0973]